MADQVEVSDALLTYVRDVSLREDPVLRELRETTAGLPLGTAMQLMPEEGQLLALFVKLCAAERVIDLGTFTGYSALAMARALGPGGRLITCDNSARWLGIAEQYWQRAGVADRIEARIGDGAKTLGELAAEFGPDSFDLIFIDADKRGNRDYFRWALKLSRVGTVIIVDNVARGGAVVDPDGDESVQGVRRLTEMLAKEPRVSATAIQTVGSKGYDGFILARVLAL